MNLTRRRTTIWRFDQSTHSRNGGNHQTGPSRAIGSVSAQKKGVTFREVPFGEDLIRGICGIYNETPVRQGKVFLTMERLWNRLERGQRHFWTGVSISEPSSAKPLIGFIKLTTDVGRTQACMVHILSMIEHNDKAPTNALIAKAVRYCAEHKIPLPDI